MQNKIPMPIHPEMNATASPLLKYSFLNGAGAIAKERFIATCRKNFLVYVASVHLDTEENVLDANTIDEGRTRCTSSVPMMERDSIYLRSDSKENIKIQAGRASTWKETKQRPVKKYHKQKKQSKLYKFIKRIMASKSTKSRLETSINEVFMGDINDSAILNESINMSIDSAGQTQTSSMLQLKETAPGENVNLETIQEIQDLSTLIEENDNSICDMILKYVQDESKSNKLINAVSIHTHLLEDISQRIHDVNHEHWMQQVEIYEEEHNNLKASVHTIKDQNLQLVEENEALVRQNQKMKAALASQNSRTSAPQPIVEDWTKSNNRLRSKIQTLLKQITNMEETIKNFQKQSQFLRQQLTNSNAQLHENKVMCEKNKTEYEMKTAKLSTELQLSTNLIELSTEQENLIMQDLEMLQIQLRPISETINWDKIQKSACPLPELIRLNRSFISELSSALIYKQNDVNIAKYEVETLKIANCHLGPLRDEIKELHIKLEQYENEDNSQKDEIQRRKEQLATNEIQIASLTSIISEKDNQIVAKENNIKARDGEIAILNEKIMNGKNDCNEQQFLTDKLRHENNALHTQMSGLAELITATGSGDIVKELANTQEKLTIIQTQCFTLAAENSSMTKELETNKNERKTLVAYQKKCYEQLQVHHREIEKLEKSNVTLKEQFDTEKQTVTALQAERVRHLEERTILTAMYERLTSEIRKVEQLEGAVTSMKKKASKLALIAEYNIQLGEKLQNDVAKRDEAINELQNNVKQLNSFQMESSAEKVALCEELHKVSSIKEVLNTKLTAELEKNLILDESKKEIQNSANVQLKEIQEAYNREHLALKDLVNDAKQLVTERNSLLDINKTNENKCEVLMEKYKELVDAIATLQQSCAEKDEKLSALERLSEKRAHEVEEMNAAKENEIHNLKAKLETTISQNETLKTQNSTIKKSLNNLHCDISNIRNKLELTQRNEKLYKKNLEDLQTTYNELCRDYKKKVKCLEKIFEQNSALKINVYSLNDKFKCVSEENERISQESLRLETMLDDKFQTTKLPGATTPKYVENLLDDINARDEEILNLQDRLRENEEHCMELNDLIETISGNNSKLQKNNQQLELQLKFVLDEVESQRGLVDSNAQILEEYKTQSVLRYDFEAQHKQFTEIVEQEKIEYAKQLETMNQELSSLRDEKLKLNAEITRLVDNANKYKEAHDELQIAHKTLALKLFTAVRILFYKQTALDASETKLKLFQDEKQSLLKTIDEKQDEYDNINNQLSVVREENAVLYEDMNKARLEIHEKLRLEDHAENVIKTQLDYIDILKKKLEDSCKTSDNLQKRVTDFETYKTSTEFEKTETELRIHELQVQAHSESARNNEMKYAMQSAIEIIIEMKKQGRITPNIQNELLQSLSDVHV